MIASLFYAVLDYITNTSNRKGCRLQITVDYLKKKLISTTPD